MSTEMISVQQARQAEAVGRQVRVQGWVRTRRDSKAGFSFLELNDGSLPGQHAGRSPTAELANYETEIKQLGAGCSVTRRGRGQGLARQGAGHRGAGQPGRACTARPMPRRYPLQKKRHTFEFLRTIAHLRPRTNTFGAIARVRNCVCRSIHDFFQEQGFLYVHPPIITASDCEGAGQMFRVTTLDLAKPPKQARRRASTSRRTSSTGRRT